MNPEYQQYPSSQEDLPIKKYIRYGVILLAAIFVIWLITFVYGLLTTSSVEIDTNNRSNMLTLQETSPKYKTIDLGSKKEVYKTRLARGTYTLTAKNGYASAQQIFTVGKSSKKVSINVNTAANQEGTVETVSDLGAFSLIADPNTIRFIDKDHTPNQLFQIDARNTVSVIAPGTTFDAISWADPSFGVGKAGKKLMAITGTTIINLTPPVTPATFAVAPNHDVYVSDGSSLYRGANGQDFTKISSVDTSEQMGIVSASNNTVLLTEKSTSSTREADLVTLHKDGSKQKIDGEIYEGVWSKSGTYLALSGDTSGIFNNKLQRVVNMPINNANALSWFNDNTLIYAVNNLLWQFNVVTRQSSVLATTPNGAGTVSALTPNSDGSTIYLTIQNSNVSNGFSFYLARYRFNSKPNANQLFQKLSLALPNDPEEGCHAGYVNFTGVAVTVSSVADLQQDCLAQTKAYLQSYDIDPNAVGYQLIPQ